MRYTIPFGWPAGAVAAVAMLICTMAARATPYVISTSAAPADGWRAIGPVGNLEGQPIASVGLDWEAAHVGWNTSLSFDDSDAAGGHTPVARDVARYGGTSTNNIWASGAQTQGDTPGYYRKVFTLDGAPRSASFGSSLPFDFSNVIDDDVQIYLNGTLVLDDQNLSADFFPPTDVTAYLHAGPNLLAVKTQDSVGGDEHFSLTLRIDTVPEPGSLIPILGAAWGACVARPRRRAPSRTKNSISIR